MTLPATSLLAQRHARIHLALDALGLDALMVTYPPNIRYLTNHVGSAGVLVLTRTAAHLAIDFRYQDAVASLQRSDFACPGLRTWAVPGSYDESVIGCLIEIGVIQVGFEAAHLTVARHEWMRRALSSRGADVRLRSTERVVEQLRLIKDAAEIEALRDAASRINAVAEAGFAAVRPGVSERTVAAALESAMRAAGYERMAFDTIVASGPNAALPHHRAGDRVLTLGDVVVLDFGGVLDGYCCDLTRTVSVGPPSAEAVRVHAAVRDAQQAAIAAVRPGIEASRVDDAARNVLAERGLGEAFGHGTGHGLGLDVHEEPRITRPRTDVPPVPLEAGMVFTIEPGAYVSGWGGVRIEDDVLVTPGGCHVLTSVPRELLALE
jgi:Xaa-Pro aminopeptidase